MIERVTRAEGRALLQAQKKPHKYHAKTTVVDGIRFDSKREAERWSHLKLSERAGLISDLQRQVPFSLHAPVRDKAGDVVGMAIVSSYVADFVFIRDGQRIISDAKGALTQAYRAKRRHMLIEYGIIIEET